MTDQITDLLEQIETLAQEATPGPWESRTLPVPVLGHTATLHAENSEGETWTTEFPPEIGSLLHEDDAAFTSLARTALPQLASVITEILAFVEFAEKMHTDNDEFDLAVRSCILRIREAIENGMEANNAA